MKKLWIMALLVLCTACFDKKDDPQPARKTAAAVATGTYFCPNLTELELETGALTIDGHSVTVSQDSLGYVFQLSVTQDEMSDHTYRSYRGTISGDSVTLTPCIVDSMATPCTVSLQWGSGTINSDGSVDMQWQYSTLCNNHYHWSGTFKK